MKKTFFKLMAILLVGFVSFTACDKDDDIVIPPPPVGETDATELADGYYVYTGGIEKFADIPGNGLMMVTKNEMGQEERATMFESFYEVDASKGFHIIQVNAGSVYYLGGGAVEAVAEPHVDEPNMGLWKGTYGSDSAVYNVEEAGVYHIVIDETLSALTISKVDWGLIGAATPGGWSTSTSLPKKSSDATSIVWEGTEIELKEGEFKFRYSNGWKIFIDETEGAEVNVNTNVGGAVDALTPGGDNIAWDAPAIYTVTLTYTYGTGYSAVMTKTGDLGVTDWTNAKFDLFGTGVSASNATAIDDASSWAWGKAVDSDGAPTITGNVETGAVFTYKWTDVMLDAAVGEGFGVRSVIDGEYNGTVLRYAAVDSLRSDLSIVVPTTNSFNDVNFDVSASGTYDVYLVIDAANKDAMKVTVVAAGAYFGDYWTMVGDATPNGWNDNAMTPNVDGTVWTWTGALSVGNFKFRKNSDWTEQVGLVDGSWAFAGGDPGAYAVETAGDYTVTLDVSGTTPAVTIE